MARRVFFSFHFEQDNWRVWQVRNSNVVRGYEEAGFFDEGEWKDLRSKGKEAIQRAIRKRLDRSSVTALLIGTHTHERDWVLWEIEESLLRGNGMLGVYINHLEDSNKRPSPAPAMRFSLPVPFPCLRWSSAHTEPFREAVEAAGERADKTTAQQATVNYLGGVQVVPRQSLAQQIAALSSLPDPGIRPPLSPGWGQPTVPPRTTGKTLAEILLEQFRKK